MAFSMKTGISASALQTRSLAAAPSKALLHPTLKITTSFTTSRDSAAGSKRRVVAKVRSSGKEDVDFDKILNGLADKFEKSDKKAAVIGYSAAAIGALWLSEWLIHLPGLNFLLGFPIQLLGLLLLPYLSVKYFVDNDSITDDTGKAVDRVVKRLPGFDK